MEQRCEWQRPVVDVVLLASTRVGWGSLPCGMITPGGQTKGFRIQKARQSIWMEVTFTRGAFGVRSLYVG